MASTRKSLAERKLQTTLENIRRIISYQDPPRDFLGALQGKDISLIAEIKRASPSRGLLRRNLVASSLARIYSQSGAAAISVLTESEYFWGSYADLTAARTEVGLPLLCKDFIVDPYQIYEARAHGADAVLLIVAPLSQRELKHLLDTIHSLGMSALVEVHSRQELMKALKLSPRMIGINNRNLADFDVDLQTTLSLRPLIPQEIVVVSESGIHTRNEVLSLQNAGVHAVLVGEVLVSSPDPAAKIDELLGHKGQR